MTEPITLDNNKLQLNSALLEWCMHCNSSTFGREQIDVGARMYALSNFLPDITARQLVTLATGAAAWVINTETNTLTLLPTKTNG